MWIPLSYFFLYRFYQSLTTGKCEQRGFTPVFSVIHDYITTTRPRPMPQIIKTSGGIFSKRELLRINPSTSTIEVSTNEGCSWTQHCVNNSYAPSTICSSSVVRFSQPLPVDSMPSTNAARLFTPRCVSNSSYGDFLNLQTDGTTLLTNTTRRLYYSTNGGRGWMRR